MHKIVDAIIGDGKKANPARKYAVYAGIITFVALIAALAVLIASSIVFAIRDRAPEEAPQEETPSEDQGTGVSSAIEYATVTAAALENKLDSVVEFKSITDRAIDNNTKTLYYAKKNEVKLTSGAMDSLHKMMVDFYTANKATLKTDIDSADCNIPLVINSADKGTKLEIVDFSGEKTIKGVSTYNWIFTNAYKYGFIYENNTFTYVGVPAATYQKTGTLATLVTKLKGLTDNARVSAITAGASRATSYQLYYVAANAELKVPTNYDYSVIADGTSGYIIVVNTSKKIATQSGGAAG